MSRCYSDAVPCLKPLPAIWLFSDARNAARLEAALRRLPHGSGLVFRHYHLPPPQRRALFDRLARLARARGHVIALAASRAEARAWGADLAYGAGGHLVPVHDLRELRKAGRALAVVLSPVHPTRSHPGGSSLGPVRFQLIAALAKVPVIALGGMDAKRARQLNWPYWGGIDAFLR